MSVFPPLSFTATSMAADATKRLADQRIYDWIMTGPVGQFLRSLGSRGKLGAEAVIYLVSAALKWQFDDSTSLSQYLNEVLGDAGSEIAGRMHAAVPGVTPPAPLSSLLGMEATAREQLLAWYRTLDPATQTAFRQRMASMARDLTVFAGLSDLDKTTLLTMNAAPAIHPVRTINSYLERFAHFVDPFAGR